MPYPAIELKSTRPWLQSVKVKLSVPQGLTTSSLGLKFGIQRPPVGITTEAMVAVLPL